MNKEIFNKSLVLTSLISGAILLLLSYFVGSLMFSIGIGLLSLGLTIGLLELIN